MYYYYYYLIVQRVRELSKRVEERERERELHLYAFGPKLVSLYPGAIFRLKIYMTDSLSLT